MKQFHARGLCNSTPWLAEAVRSRAFKTGSIGRGYRKTTATNGNALSAESSGNKNWTAGGTDFSTLPVEAINRRTKGVQFN